ncbi:Sugar kinase of the NBD/HSP70 family, may contain an N-terminal HTH domain [Sanguibacter gelidistatuariae]|uniref:Sugar kinase of the NBD/HSP70 family, may contain an N-terminal HTH domain n=1 Tax=Sanguibacter gelidistatuariae TaxID=1814289 RepID=A0A1G6QA39_9MICO|nr:ROK family protein [Sanguibacter gelidistatuariae]SDC88527.1 Sugar kinase of the NBD/HSP70 family, may contain an N-terminal HTH domain [Sanguibacter gelidistatuariae]
MSDDGPASRPVLAVPKASTVTSLRQRNRAAVLKQIILSQETTRATIAKECDLSAASATNLVAELIGDGLVHETGSISSRGGRPITLIAPCPDSAYAIGADIGERGVAVELFDLSMRRVDREFRGGGAPETPKRIALELGEAVDALRARNPEASERLLGIGLGLPGLVETAPDGRQTLYAQSLGWPAVPIEDLIRTDVPVYAENGAKTQAKAELWFGAARGVKHALVVLLGRGSGLGVVADGKLAVGASGSAGEWGHTKIVRGGRPCRCGNLGCIEAYVGADAILEAWRELGGTFDGTGWGALGALIDAAHAGEPAARTVLDDVIDTLGASLGGMVNLTNPQRIVVGGWVGLRLMETCALQIETAIRANALTRLGAQFELFTSTFGGDTVALGSALMPVEALIADAPD